MKKILVTGGTVFVSRYIAEYYVKKGYEVYILNRNHWPQPKGTRLILADRHQLGSVLFPFHFDVIIDTAYTSEEVEALLNALGSYDQYILISSSAVYPEYCPQPFTEETPTGPNRYWGIYGINKIDAETRLLTRNPNAYIIRPPYLYGPMNNLYREAFVFDCALKNRPFYLPADGSMKLQFFHIHDLCRFLDALLKSTPSQHIFNVGNKTAVSALEWAALCYRIAGKMAEFVFIPGDIEQRNYFSFYSYEYYLDVSKQSLFLMGVKSLEEGLEESFSWYQSNPEKVIKKPFLHYIDTVLAPTFRSLH